MASLKGKVAIITGAGQGIGRGIALALARQGAGIVIGEINMEAANAVAGEIRKLGGKAVAVPCDVSKEDQVKAMVASAVREFGRIDILVNNAQKVPRSVPLEELDLAEWDGHFESGPKGTLFCSKAVFPHMKDRGGRIINLASRIGIQGRVGMTAYAASKEAIRGFTRNAAREWGKYGITVNVLCPAVITPANLAWQERFPEEARQLLQSRPIPRWGDPEKDVGSAAVYLASDEAGYVTGQTINVSGGDHMF